MKKGIFIFLMFIGFGLLPAQNIDSSRLDKIDVVKEYRKELWKSKLNVSDKQLEEFLGVYNEYQLALRTSKRNFRRKWYAKDVDNLSESDAKEYINEALELQQTEHDLMAQYAPQFAAVVGWSKAARIKKLDREIKPLLLIKANELKVQKKPKSRTSTTKKKSKP